MLVLRQFLLLIWKGFKLRLRHFVVSIFELILPLVIMAFIIYLQSLGDSYRNNKDPAVTFSEEEIDYKFCFGDILYTPNNSATLQIVNRVLDLNPRGCTATATKDEKEMLDKAIDILNKKDWYYYWKNQPFGLVFENVNPPNLKYKLRRPGTFKTESKFSSGRYFSGGGDYDSGFLQMQAAVDRAFINYTLQTQGKTSEYSTTEQTLQGMPYPSHYNNYVTLLWFVPLMIVTSFMFLIMVFVKRLVDEKANRAKELMRMMGMNDFVYFAGNWLVSFIPMAFIFTLAIIFFKIPVGLYQKSVLNYSAGFMIWLILLLYAANSLLFCMVISTFFNRPVLAAIVTFIIWILTHMLPAFLLDNPGDENKYLLMKKGPKLAICLLPNAALHFTFKIISFYESTGVGSTWSNGSVPMPGDDLSVSLVVGMMVASCCICCFIIWYVDNVWPWQYGIPKHPAFFLMPSYWIPNKSKLSYSSFVEDLESPDVDQSYFEEEPRGKNQGITVNNLVKSFGWGSSRKVAVNNLSLNMYHGEITALLGHNGAGKTTTLNIITGLFPPSSGTALVNGYSVLDNAKQARRSLGLCPQHNVLYDSLTVEEHLTLFAGLKGRTFKEIRAEITSCLDFLQLQHKRTDLAKTLSGGMKRKLSLGIAMIGGSEVLILDEPTSGMDPQARRAIWDLLTQIKQNRTIVLTTHYMEEADILGDRIAIMADGVVKCCGSPLFLKKKFGAGYHLRISKGGNFQQEKLLNVIQESVPTAYVDSDMNTEVSYVLPVTESKPFVEMFESLESQKNDIDYTACGLTITTMEDVFIKVGQLAEKTCDENGEMITEPTTERDSLDFMIDPVARLSGSPLWLQQFRGLLAKRMHDSKRYIPFTVFLLILPLVITFLMLYVRNSLFSTDNLKPLPLDLEAIYGETVAYYRVSNHTNATFGNIVESVYRGAGAKPQDVPDLTEIILSIGEKSLAQYKTSLVVAGNLTVDENSKLKVTSVYNKAAIHSSAISLNLMNVALLRAATEDDTANIKITNEPFPTTDSLRRSSQSEMDPLVRLIISCFLPLALSFLSSSFVLFPIHERQTKSKLIQLMTGVNGMTFWGTHFLWDYGMHLLASCFMLIPFGAMDIFGSYSSSSGALGVLFLMLMLYGWTSIPLSYLMSFISKKPSTGFVLVCALNFITGMMATLAVTIYKLMITGDRNATDHSETIAWFLRLLPSFAMTWGTANLDNLAKTYTTCQTNSTDPGFSQKNCDIGLASFEAGACGRDMLFMFLSGLIYFFILASLETNLVRFWYRLRDALKRQPVLQNMQSAPTTFPLGTIGTVEDSDVAAERTKVEQLYQQNYAHQEALLVYDLTKHFGNVNAVDHVSFIVHRDECFGLLGVNGAGKTTTFSMLTGDLTIGEGTAIIGHCSVREDLDTFQSQIGYCPQFDALLDRLTGRESLYLFARLRGVPEKDIPRVVTSLIGVVDLQQHADKTADKYSGGNRRKLSLALALIGSPPVVFLDEPTAGVDPASRRKIWNAFMKVQRTGGTSFILTTHSMEECEALCGRLVIMVNGQFRCLGPIQYLKSKFGQGYTIIVKLNKEQHLQPQATVAVQQFFANSFPGCILKDIHEGMLHYHIVDTRYPWSHLFREMERAKMTFNLEDYLISDTTLEQIFLAFARTQRIVA